MTAFTFEVRGMAPAPKGSKRHLGNGVMVESSKTVKPWMLLVTDAAVRSGAPLTRGPVSMAVTFVFARPKGHYGKRGLLPSAPRWPAVKPDVDKLLRSTADALSGVLYEDDARVVSVTMEKRYAVGDELPGAVITLVPLEA